MESNIEYGIGYTSDYSESANVKMSFIDTQIGHFTKVVAVINNIWIADLDMCAKFNH